MKRLVIYFGLVILSLTITTNVFAQNIAISDVSHTADASAVLDVYSSSLGMLVPRMTTPPSSPANGLIYYNTSTNHLMFYDGSTWNALDYNDPWISSGGSTYLSNPGDMVGIGTSIPSNPITTLANNSTHIFMEDNVLGGDIGISYNNTNTGSVAAYSTGLISSFNQYVIRNTSAISVGTQSDGNTMLTAHYSGILDFSNQSRARVFQSIQYDANHPNAGQLIPFANWTEIFYDLNTYDEHGEFTLGNYQTGAPSFFKASEEGYYQVNARIDFILYDIINGEAINHPYPDGYVSIAIFVSTDGGNTYNMTAQGNKLQGTDNNFGGGDTDLQNNISPNLSDVIHLNPGDMVKIFAWQSVGHDGTSGIPLPLRIKEQNGVGGPDTQIYCSIHKAS